MVLPVQAVPSGGLATRKPLRTLLGHHRHEPGEAPRRRPEYIAYRQLCWHKHANPLLQKLHGVQISKGEIPSYNGPDTSDTSIRAAGFALETAAHLTYLAISSFVKNHLPVDRQQPVVQRANELGEEKKNLRKHLLKGGERKTHSLVNGNFDKPIPK